MPNVTLSRFHLEKALGVSVDRYERASDGALGYAQIDIAEDQDQWGAAVNCVQSIADAVQRLVSEKLIGPPCLDVAMKFLSSVLSSSIAIPARLAAAVGKAGMDIDISAYRTSDRPV
jgi:hypothetical protein